MKRLMLAVATTLLFLNTAPAAAQELWGGARAGMSVEAIKKVFPDAVPVSDPKHPEKLLLLPKIKIQGTLFAGDFFFENEKLKKVRLRPAGELKNSDAVYKGILSALRAKYGQEANQDVQNDGNIVEQTWFTAKKRIKLLGVMMAVGETSFAIFYDSAATGDLDKL